MCRCCTWLGKVLPAALLLICSAVHAAENTSSLYYSITDDAGYVLSKPASWKAADWQDIGLAGIAIAGTALWLDMPIRNSWGKHPGENAGLMQIEKLGAEYAIGVIGGFYLAGTFGDSVTSRRVARDALSASIIASGIITPSIKIASGRSRPFENAGNADFNGLGARSLNSSFPSGHTTEAFALASVISSHYESSSVQYTAYGLASVVGYARIYHDAHFASDVIAGGLIGYWTGKAVVRHQASGGKSVYLLLPEVSADQAGLKLTGIIE